MNQGAATDEDRTLLEAIAKGEFGRQAGLERRHLDIACTIANDQVRRGAKLEGIRLFATVVLCDPTHREGQVGLASAALEVGEPYIAIQAAAMLIATAPFDPLGYLLSGKACQLAGEWPEARDDLQRASELAQADQNGSIAAEAQMLLNSLPTAPAGASDPGSERSPPALQFG